MIEGQPRMVAAYYKWNTPRARWNEVDVMLASMFYPNYARKYVFSDGTEVVRGPNEELFNDDGKIPELDNED